MRLTNALRWLLCLAVGLPMLVLVLQFSGRLLAVMGDEAGARALRGVAIGAGIAWGVALLGIVIVMAVDTVSRDEPPNPPRGGQE